MRSLTYIIIATFLALLVACSRGERDYSSWEQLPADGWAYTDTVSLLPVDTSLTDNDSIIDGTLHVALRHNNAYPYSNIWLELTYHSDGPWLMRDTINMPLADLYGRWLGSGFGTGYQRDLTVSPRSRIDLTRPVALRHIMRVDTLRGIEQVGIFIKNSGSSALSH